MIKPVELGFGDLSGLEPGKDRGNAQVFPLQLFFDYGQAGFTINREEGFTVTPVDWNHAIIVWGIGQLEEVFHEIDLGKGHVAGDEKIQIGAGAGQSRKNSAQDSGTRDQVTHLADRQGKQLRIRPIDQNNFSEIQTVEPGDNQVKNRLPVKD